MKLEKRDIALIGMGILVVVGFAKPWIDDYLKPKPNVLPIVLPSMVQGQPNRIIEIHAETKGKIIQWKVVSDTPVGVWNISEDKLGMMSSQNGRFHVLAWTAISGKPTEAAECLVTIGDDPGPGPGPDPLPNDEFSRKLSSTWGSDVAPDKRKNRDCLVEIYKHAATDQVKDPGLKTVRDLLITMQTAARSLLPEGALQAERQVIQGELDSKLPTTGDKPLDQATRDLCATQFLRVANTLARLP